MNLFRSISLASSWSWWSVWMRLVVCLLLGVACSTTPSLYAQKEGIRFDVFLGFDKHLHEGEWFPVVCEVENTGPGFVATFELSPERSGSSQTRRYQVELPTDSLKRFVVPAFSTGGGYGRWNARLLDSHGEVRARRQLGGAANVQAWQAPLIGALPANFSAMPSLPKINSKQEEFQPRVARLQAKLFPDSPIALEGLDMIYLNSKEALKLGAEQVDGLMRWLRSGGHLVLAIEQPSDITATPWLRRLSPCQVGNLGKITTDQALHRFAESGASSDPSQTSSEHRFNLPPKTYQVSSKNKPLKLEPDADFRGKTLVVTETTPGEGKVLISSGEVPLAIRAFKGRGQISLLTFSPSREPFLSWQHRDWFWSSLIGIPSDWYDAEQFRYYGGQSLDGVFGSMIESRQVRKLPVVWLLVLLGVYLLVIGPIDHFSLKRLNRQMLTWITFPLYVILFSALIYYIGYRLRAGEKEWNELHVVDVVPGEEESMLRGWTYASVYSPVNASYPVASDLRYATLRPEFQGTREGGQESSRAAVLQGARGFRANLSVPVWTSQLFVSDWQKPSTNLLEGKLVRRKDRLKLTLRNRLDSRLDSLWLAFEGRLYKLDSLRANASRQFEVAQGRAFRDLDELASRYRDRFADALRSRGRALSTGSEGRLEREPMNAIAASLVSLTGDAQARNIRRRGRGDFLMAPNRFDVSPLIARGQAVVFAWAENFSPIEPLNQFKPKRLQRDTLFRLALPERSPSRLGKTVNPESATTLTYE